MPPILYIVCDLCHPYYILSVIRATQTIAHTLKSTEERHTHTTLLTQVLNGPDFEATNTFMTHTLTRVSGGGYVLKRFFLDYEYSVSGSGWAALLGRYDCVIAKS